MKPLYPHFAMDCTGQRCLNAERSKLKALAPFRTVHGTYAVHCLSN